MKSSAIRRFARFVAVAVVCLSAAACTTPPPGAGLNGEPFDPYEQVNRRTHEFNRAIDRALYRPASIGYTAVVPDEIEDGINNVSRNIGMPRVVVNALLQGDLKTAGIGTARFVFNSTIGILGIGDAATAFGIPQADTDFGETLHVWGFPEGAYVELPFFGPSTERDAAGLVVDFFLNPLSYLSDPEHLGEVALAARVMERLSDRGRFSDVIDSILYESADSYAQGRIIYLQNRRFELGQAGPEIDPFDLDTEGF